MIASLAGVVESVGLDRLVVRVGGVGLLVHTTPTTAGSARTGGETTLVTSLVVREGQDRHANSRSGRPVGCGV